MLTINLDHLKIEPNHRILDLGCGEGRHAISTYLLSEADHIIAVDLSFKDITTANKRLLEFKNKDSRKACNIFVGDGLQLPFANDCFDAVICSEVLEHIPQYEKIIKEIQRVTKVGGTLAVSVPRAWPERICWWLSRAYHQVEGGHIRIFNSEKLKSNIEEHLFKFNKKHWAHALHTPYWWLRCLFWRSDKQLFLVRWYHKILVWDLMEKPWLTQNLEKMLNPIMGKSVVMYFTKK